MKQVVILFVFITLNSTLFSQDLEKFKIYKIDPKTHNGIDLSYTVPEVFKEKQSAIPSIYKSYSSPLINNSYLITQEIGITSNEVELKDNSKDEVLNKIERLFTQELGANYKLVSKQKTKLYLLDAFKLRSNFTLNDDQDKYYKDQILYTVFIGKNVVRFIYNCIYNDIELLKSNAKFFEEYVNDQTNNIIIRNIFYNKSPDDLYDTKIGTFNQEGMGDDGIIAPFEFKVEDANKAIIKQNLNNKKNDPDPFEPQLICFQRPIYLGKLKELSYRFPNESSKDYEKRNFNLIERNKKIDLDNEVEYRKFLKLQSEFKTCILNWEVDHARWRNSNKNWKEKSIYKSLF